METLTPRQIKNKVAKQEREIASHKAQKPVKEMTITIEWKKSYTWGNNPNAEVRIQFQDGTFAFKDGYRASGCGYDKESTVIAEIFNDFLRYKLYQKRKFKSHGDEKTHPYGVYYFGGDTKKVDNCADWYLWKPSYSGGVGTSCYYDIAKFIGGKFENAANGKTFGVFKYTDGAK